MAPLDTMNNFLEPSTSNMFSSTKQEESAIPQLSFDGLLSQEIDLPSSKLPFVWKLFEMLEGVEKDGDNHIISWVESGKAFKVHKMDDFVDNIVPIYFKQSKYKSFQRQLNFYNFTRITSGRNAGAYYHPQFLQGSKTLCLSIRPKATNKARKPTIQKPKPAKTPSNQDSQWMEQMESLMANGAAHGMERYSKQESAPIDQNGALPPRHQLIPQLRTQQRTENLHNSGTVTIFDGMPFHFIS